MKVIGVIPARYNSTRFPGKPITAFIYGKPMIWWVYQQCKKVKEFNEVYIATDSNEIYKVCQMLKLNVEMTSDQHLTGTDRVWEVASRITADLIVNIQGDEPLIEPSTISAVINPFRLDSELQVSSVMSKITDPLDLVNPNITKVITNGEGIALYLTRAAAPYPKGCTDFDYHKQVSVFAYRPNVLKFFYEYGIRNGKGMLEKIEDIEILRYIENGYKVQYIEVESETVAVDTQDDLRKVQKVIARKISAGELSNK